MKKEDELLNDLDLLMTSTKIPDSAKEIIKEARSTISGLQCVVRQEMWEKSVAVEQLHDLGYEFGEKINCKALRWEKLGEDNYPSKKGTYLCCASAFLVDGYIYRTLGYDNDLYALSDDFSEYKGKQHKGFYTYDSEFGFLEEDSVIAWAEIPEYEGDKDGD